MITTTARRLLEACKALTAGTHYIHWHGTRWACSFCGHRSCCQNVSACGHNADCPVVEARAAIAECDATWTAVTDPETWDEAEEEARRRTVVDGKPWGVAHNEEGNLVVRLAEDPNDPEDIDLS